MDMVCASQTPPCPTEVVPSFHLSEIILACHAERRYKGSLEAHPVQATGLGFDPFPLLP